MHPRPAARGRLRGRQLALTSALLVQHSDTLRTLLYVCKRLFGLGKGTQTSLVMSRGKRFESARRLSLIGLSKRNVREARASSYSDATPIGMLSNPYLSIF